MNEYFDKYQFLFLYICYDVRFVKEMLIIKVQLYSWIDILLGMEVYFFYLYFFLINYERNIG